MFTSSAMWCATGVRRSRRSAGMVRMLSFRDRLGMAAERSVLPARSPYPLMQPCTWVTPACTATSELATAQPASLWQWIPSWALVRARTSATACAHVVGQRAAVGVAQHERLGAGLLRRGQDRQCELGVARGSRRRSAPHRGRRAGRARAGSARSRPPWPPPRRARCAAPRRRGGPTTWPRCRRPAPRPRSGWPGRRRSRA